VGIILKEATTGQRMTRGDGGFEKGFDLRKGEKAGDYASLNAAGLACWGRDIY